MVHLTLTGLWRKKCSELLHNTFLCHGARPCLCKAQHTFRRALHRPPRWRNPSLALPISRPGSARGSAQLSPIYTPNSHPTQHGGGKKDLNAPHRCQQEIKTKRIQARHTATFFFRSRDRLRCFLFFSVSSSALISKSLFFFNCEAA